MHSPNNGAPSRFNPAAIGAIDVRSQCGQNPRLKREVDSTNHQRPIHSGIPPVEIAVLGCNAASSRCDAFFSPKFLNRPKVLHKGFDFPTRHDEDDITAVSSQAIKEVEEMPFGGNSVSAHDSTIINEDQTRE